MFTIGSMNMKRYIVTLKKCERSKLMDYYAQGLVSVVMLHLQQLRSHSQIPFWLLADEAVELEYVESVARETV